MTPFHSSRRDEACILQTSAAWLLRESSRGSIARRPASGPIVPAVIANKSHHATAQDEKYRVTPYPELIVDAGEMWSETFALTNASPEIAREWRVPPGRHTIRFRYRPSKDHIPTDALNLCWFVALFRLEEVPTSR